VNVLLDCGPEIRLQLLRAHVSDISFVLLTHAHADHINGIDDLRPLARSHPIPIFGNPSTISEVAVRFDYIFARSAGPMTLHEISETVEISGIRVTPVPLMHGALPTLGYRFGNFAYLTDANRIPPSSCPLLKGVELLVIDALGIAGHSTHFSFGESLAEIAAIRPKRAWFTHICDSMRHVEIEGFIAQAQSADPALAGIQIRPSFDGLRIDGVQLANDGQPDSPHVTRPGDVISSEVLPPGARKDLTDS
jgi:phosphoribosyl 1,2-cyclic phosphate phosphodiesterase